MASMETSYVSIGLLFMLALAYFYMNGNALATLNSCESLKEEKKGEIYKQYWITSLIFACSVAFTMLLLKFVQANGPILIGLISLITVIGSGLYFDTLKKCEGDDKEKKMSYIYMAGFSVLFLASVASFNRFTPPNNSY